MTNKSGSAIAVALIVLAFAALAGGSCIVGTTHGGIKGLFRKDKPDVEDVPHVPLEHVEATY